jgi:hypothetical protein
MANANLPARGLFSSNAQQRKVTVLLAILLDAGGSQACKTVLIDRKLPGEEFVDRQGVSAASLFKREQATADCGNDFRLAADDPTLSPGCG